MRHHVHEKASRALALSMILGPALLLSIAPHYPMRELSAARTESAPALSPPADCPLDPQNVVLLDMKANGGVGKIISGQNNPRVTPTFAGGSAGGFGRARVELNLEPPCDQATILVEYEGEAHRWTVHLSDSPTGDGDGGMVAPGATLNSAELVVREPGTNQLPHKLEVFASQAGQGAMIASYDVNPYDSALRFVVRNQHLWWGQPHTKVEPNQGSNRLFQIPDTGPSGDGYKIYLGINRVYKNPLPTDRWGVGVRRVMIWVADGP